MKKVLKFSDEFKIKWGFKSIDLEKYGDCSLPEEVIWDEENGYGYAFVDYDFKGWSFSNCELSWIPKEIPEKIEYAEDIFNIGWDEWTIYPTEKTKIIEKGVEKDLRGTAFEDYLKEV